MDELYKLYNYELYSNAKELALLIVTVNNANRSFLLADEHFVLFTILANSCFEEKSFLQAKEYYQRVSK